MQARILPFIPAIVIMGIIFFLSHQTGNSFNLPDIPDLDKILHCLVYGVLASTSLVAINPDYRRRQPLLTCALVIGFCLLYGISDEFHQSFIPGRMPSFWDIAADGTGALLVVSLWYFLPGRCNKQPA